MDRRIIHIVGAGPASLVAAINLAKAGFKTIIHEQNNDVGKRFKGDFQGLENWSTKINVLEFLKSIGISINFRCEPYSDGTFFGPDLEKIPIKPSRPLFYLIERGLNEWSLDQGLKRQAIEEGVRIRWNDKIRTVGSGMVIVGTGPKAADIIARGIVFQTSHPDGYYIFVNDRISPKGYAYLLVNKGKGTFAICLFNDFKYERTYFVRALETMKSVVKIDLQYPKEFGGYGNFFLRDSITKDGRILYIGENAGLQDALWGFGLRYGMLSGYLAAYSIIKGKSYDNLYRTILKPMMETSLANRWLFAHLGNYGYRRIFNRISHLSDVIEELYRHYHPSWIKLIFFQLARHWYHTRLLDEQCSHKHCNCVWCRGGQNIHKNGEREILKSAEREKKQRNNNKRRSTISQGCCS